MLGQTRHSAAGTGQAGVSSKSRPLWQTASLAFAACAVVVLLSAALNQSSFLGRPGMHDLQLVLSAAPHMAAVPVQTHRQGREEEGEGWGEQYQLHESEESEGRKGRRRKRRKSKRKREEEEEEEQHMEEGSQAPRQPFSAPGQQSSPPPPPPPQQPPSPPQQPSRPPVSPQPPPSSPPPQPPPAVPVPATAVLLDTGRDVQGGEEAQRELQSACQKLVWFTGLGGQSYGEYEDYLKAALLSALDHAPSLVPVLIHGGQPDGLSTWFQEHGGHLVHHNLSFFPAFEAQTDPTWREELMAAKGVYLRLDIPMVMQRIVEEGLVDMHNVSTRYALYTDSDVMFVGGDVSTCNVPLPEVLSIGPEHEKGRPANTGVMLFNIPAFSQVLPELLQYGEQHQFRFGAYDQGLLLDWHRDTNRTLEGLPDRMDWKGYWGSDGNATILHWHGPKPNRCMPCYLEHRADPKEVRDAACSCPGVYNLLVSFAPDGMALYARMLQRFKNYVQHAAEPLPPALPPPQALPTAVAAAGASS